MWSIAYVGSAGRLLAFLLLAPCIAIMTGCAGPIAAHEANEENTVAVIAVMKDRPVLDLRGPGMFDKRRVEEMKFSGSLVQIATETIKKRIAQNKPKWHVVEANYDREGLRKAVVNGLPILTLRYDIEHIKKELAEIARQSNASLLIVVEDTYLQVDGTSDVSVNYWTGFGSATVSDAFVDLSFFVVNRQGDAIAFGKGLPTSVSIPAASVGLSQDFERDNAEPTSSALAAYINAAFQIELQRRMDAIGL